MSSTQRFPTQQLKQLRADLTVAANTLKTLTATAQILSDTLSGVTMSNATTLNPHFNTVNCLFLLLFFFVVDRAGGIFTSVFICM